MNLSYWPCRADIVSGWARTLDLTRQLWVEETKCKKRKTAHMTVLALCPVLFFDSKKGMVRILRLPSLSLSEYFGVENAVI